MNAPDPRVALVDTLIHARQHVGPKRLVAPGPDAATLRALFAAAAAAPDHAQLRPWRFLVLGMQARRTLGEVFAAALRERDPAALPEQVDEARDKAFRGPVLVLAVLDLRADAPDVPATERIVSLGGALQNLLLAAEARGWGCGLTSGRALQTARMREAFGLAEGEHAVCCVTLGTPRQRKPPRPRPAVDTFVRWLD
jgi:nitroreductase